MGQKHVDKALRSLEKVEFAIDIDHIDLKILFSSDPLSTVDQTKTETEKKMRRRGETSDKTKQKI